MGVSTGTKRSGVAGGVYSHQTLIFSGGINASFKYGAKLVHSCAIKKFSAISFFKKCLQTKISVYLCVFVRIYEYLSSVFFLTFYGRFLKK